MSIVVYSNSAYSYLWPLIENYIEKLSSDFSTIFTL